MIRIGVVGYNPNKIGGIESFSRNLNDTLTYNIEYIYEYDESGPFNIMGTYPVMKYKTFNRVLNKLSNYQYSLLKIKKLLKNKSYDVLILNSPKYLKIVPNLSKVILVQHTTMDNWWKSKLKFNEDTKLLELSRQVYKIISLSEYEKKVILQKFNYPDNLVQTINMINSLPIRSNNLFPRKSLIMLTRFQNEIKRIDLVIKAMELLPDFQLNIYGDGVDKDYLLKISSGIKNVKINPSTNEKIKVLSENGIYVLSSEFEGFPVSLLEAMSQGLPLIVRNSFLSAPCFIHGNGVLLNKSWSNEAFKDAVLHCYSNYKEFSIASLKQANEYRPEKVESMWCNLIEGATRNTQ